MYLAQSPNGYEGVNALSLDGGSIASLLSSLELVKGLMRRVQKESDLPDLPLPREHFRMMVGAGFAGLLVILLGRLGLSVQEAKRHCVAIMDEVFSEKKTFGNETFKITKLKAAVERMLESCGVAASEHMLELETGSSETCKVVVCVAPQAGMRAGSPTCLRTYTTDISALPDCTIAEAICSSLAVSGLFKPMNVAEPGGVTSTYAGLSSFNPMVQLLEEAARMFRSERLACVVSIGAAQRQASATECERVAQEMLVRFMNRPGHYFRLSVDQGMENIKAIDWERRSEGTAHARTYLSVSENDALLAGIARAVLEKNGGVPTMHLRGSIPVASSTTHTIKLCPAPSPLFVGRDDLLSWIERCLGHSQNRRVCVLHGLGGVGKTQLALKYVEIHTNNYDHIFYVDCTSNHTIDVDLKRIALAKNVGDCASDALTWLARLQKRWLIVYNNADDISINLRGYFPSCSHGSILVTTRNRGMANLACGMDANCHISNMSEDEARELLAKAAGTAEDVGTPGLVLVEMLGRFPLAIVQAGAYVRTNMCSIQDYLDMYQTSRGQILDDYASEVHKADDYELTVYATWQVSYQQLSPLAKQLYNYLAFMHHDQIVEGIFRFAVLGLKDEPHALPSTDEETRIEQMTTEFLANFTRLADGIWDKSVFLRTIKDLML